MSELKTETLTSLATGQSITMSPYVIEGTPRCMCRVDQSSSGHPTIGPSFNVSSTTDDSAGTTDISLTNASADSDSPCSGNNFNINVPVSAVGLFPDVNTLRHESLDSGGNSTDANDCDSFLYGQLA